MKFNARLWDNNDQIHAREQDTRSLKRLTVFYEEPEHSCFMFISTP